MNSRQTTVRRALSLGTAHAIDYSIQFLLPIILVRSLDAAQFGEYRLLWLLVNTVMAFAPLYMPQSLFYFLPRAGSDPGRYVANVVWYLVVAGVVAACLSGAWDPLIPDKTRNLPGSTSLIPLFILMWVLSSLLEWLANAEGRIRRQAKVIVSLSLLRALLIGAVAAATGDVYMVFVALGGFAALRLTLLIVQIGGRYGWAGFIPDRNAGVAQLTYAIPFGLAGGLYVLRQQADQWIVAAIFPVELFALFSIAGVVAPLAGLVRQSVENAILSDMNRLHEQGNLRAAIAINRQGNSLVGFVLLPILAFLFTFAEEIVSVIYTPSYAGAAKPMRVYLVGLAAQVLVVNNLLITLAAGRFQLWLNLAFLPVSIVASLLGAWAYGIAGAATGSVIAQYGSHLLSIGHVQHRVRVSLSEIIDWRTLSHLAVVAMVAALGGWLVIQAIAVRSFLMRALIGGAVFAVLWLVALFASRKSKALLMTIRRLAL